MSKEIFTICRDNCKKHTDTQFNAFYTVVLMDNILLI
jgi:hypothetical protein